MCPSYFFKAAHYGHRLDFFFSLYKGGLTNMWGVKKCKFKSEGAVLTVQLTVAEEKLAAMNVMLSHIMAYTSYPLSSLAPSETDSVSSVVLFRKLSLT